MIGQRRVGFVGVGNMGGVLAANLVAEGWEVVAHDVAGPDRCPPGATFTDRLDEVASAAEVVVLSLPDGDVSARVAGGLVGGDVRHVVDTSTVGVGAARTIAAQLTEHGVSYVDAPVSGGVAGARARTLTVMYAAADDACEAVEPVLAGLSDRRRRVGDTPGMAQAVKLLNNFLSATALAATSEAMAFAEAVGLDMATVLDVLNVSSGRSAATEDKFVNHVVTGTYASGFASALMAKDVRLYLASAAEQGTPASIGRLTAEMWQRFADAEPDADFTRIHPFIGRNEA